MGMCVCCLIHGNICMIIYCHVSWYEISFSGLCVGYRYFVITIVSTESFWNNRNVNIFKYIEGMNLKNVILLVKVLHGPFITIVNKVTGMYFPPYLLISLIHFHIGVPNFRRCIWSSIWYLYRIVVVISRQKLCYFWINRWQTKMVVHARFGSELHLVLKILAEKRNYP